MSDTTPQHNFTITTSTFGNKNIIHTNGAFMAIDKCGSPLTMVTTIQLNDNGHINIIVDKRYKTNVHYLDNCE